MENQIKQVGKSLTREEMKMILGGSQIPCDNDPFCDAICKDEGADYGYCSVKSHLCICVGP